MKITVLGCGSSGGVPLIGNDWGDCDPADPRNNRLRVSVLVEDCDTVLLIDTSPDLRQQMLNCNAQKLTAVLFTHAHADHCHGIDDLRGMNWLMGKPVDIYANAATMNDLEAKFSYIFHGADGIAGSYYKPALQPHIITGPLQIGDLKITPIEQDHAHGKTLGFRIGDFAYSTDVKRLDDAAFAALAGIKTWIVDCVREKPHPTHSHLEQTLEWISRVKPERAYLTHMNQNMDYKTIAAKLPAGVWPAHDGLVIEC